MKNKNEKLCE